MANQIQPIFILPEGTQRSSGRNAQKNNIAAAKAVAETVRTTLGPKGMDKMLVNSAGDIVVTNDGVTILSEMDIEHPAAKMIVEIAKTQEDEVGDGTTTAVVLAGELLRRAEELIEQEIHPTVIARGYRQASDKSVEILKKIAQDISAKDTVMLQKIAITAMTGKGAEEDREHLSGLAVKAVLQVIQQTGSGMVFDKSDIKLEKKVGGAVEQTELIEGIILDKEKVHPGMPSRIVGARIALVDSPVEVKDTEIDAKIQITDPSQMQAFLDMEEKMIRGKVDAVVKSGANVLFCQKGIDDVAQHYLAKAGIYAVRRVSSSDMEKLAKATAAKIVSNLEDLSKEDLGRSGLVEQVKVGDEQMTFVRDAKHAKAVSIIVRGGTEHVVAEVKRALEDAIGVISTSLINGKVVAGAGAAEMEVAKALRKFARSLSGREQLAVEAFASAMEIIPKTLAENSGLDPIDVLTDLKAAHEKAQTWAGIDVFRGKVMDAWKQNVIEPLQVKIQAITSASEVAAMILRIDDVISSGKGSKSPQGMPPGMPPGMDMGM